MKTPAHLPPFHICCGGGPRQDELYPQSTCRCQRRRLSVGWFSRFGCQGGGFRAFQGRCGAIIRDSRPNCADLRPFGGHHPHVWGTWKVLRWHGHSESGPAQRPSCLVLWPSKSRSRAAVGQQQLFWTQTGPTQRVYPQLAAGAPGHPQGWCSSDLRFGKSTCRGFWGGFGGKGLWDPKVCVPKMAQPDVPFCKFRLFPRWLLRSGGGEPPPPPCGF